MSIANEEDIEHSQFSLDSEAPHANLYSYNGVMRYHVPSESIGREHPVIEGRVLQEGGERTEPVTINELLLRGCALRNTKWVIGLVIFTGSDTKIMMNQGETPSKRSKIEKETNFNVLINFIILMVFCVTCALVDGVFLTGSKTSADYYEIGARVSEYVVVDALTTFGYASLSSPFALDRAYLLTLQYDAELL